MLDEVSANEFIKSIEEDYGATEPLILGAENNNREVEVYAKLTNTRNLSVKGLIVEAICSMLAIDLDLPTPEPFIVNLNNEFIDCIDNATIQSRLRASCPKVFATQNISRGVSTVAKDMKLNSHNLQSAANIFAFDAAIENPDRRIEKPNCLTDGQNLYIIDHEKAFPRSIGLILLGQPLNPWQLGGLNNFSSAGSHLFINQIKKQSRKLNFNPFVAKWKNISDDRINDYLQALPQEWLVEETCARTILEYIKSVRDNIDGCVDEINRILN